MENILQGNFFDFVASSVGALLLKFISNCIDNRIINKNKWKCSKEKCECDKYMWFQLKVLFFIALVGVITAILGCLICEMFDFNSYNVVSVIQQIITLVCSIMIILYYYDAKKHIAKIKKSEMNKLKYNIIKILYFMPLFYSFWIWNVLLYTDDKVLSGLFYLVFLVCNICSLIFFSYKEKYTYQYAKLFFKNNITFNVVVDNVRQDGDWLIIRDKVNEKEIRYRQNELLYVEYTLESNIVKQILE